METVCLSEMLVSIYLPSSPHEVTAQNRKVNAEGPCLESHSWRGQGSSMFSRSQFALLVWRLAPLYIEESPPKLKK
jgi:hypothetical protein